MRSHRATVGIVVLAVSIGASSPAVGGDTSAHNGRIVFQASIGATRQVLTVNADGTGLRQVTHVAFTAADEGAEQPSFSPDARTIAFDAPVGSSTGLFTIRPDGSRVHELPLALAGSSAAPAYSPDGTELAFDHDGGSSRPTVHGIYIAAVDGGNPRRITTGIATAEASDTAATWSPDGIRLCFTRVKDSGLAAIYVVRSDGSGLRRLTPWSLDASAASWAPDGSKVVFESYSTPHPGKSANLFTISPAGGAMTQLTHFSGGKTQGFGPSWSPDGRKIVWHKIGPALNQLFVMDGDGGNQRQLTHMPGNPKVSHPDWGTAG
jgi:Tol biopolymer transport system component